MKARRKKLASCLISSLCLRSWVVGAGGAVYYALFIGGIAAIGNGEDPGWQIELSTRSADNKVSLLRRRHRLFLLKYRIYFLHPDVDQGENTDRYYESDISQDPQEIVYW